MIDSSAPDTRGRAIIGLIAGVPLMIILAASWLWYFVVQGDLDLIGAIGTANNGELVQPPRQLDQTPFTDDAAAQFAWSDLEPRWTLLIPHRGLTCDAVCERRLYFTRQIHIALGRDFKRVQRVMVTDSPLASMVIHTPTELPEGWPTGFAGEELKAFLGEAHKGLVALATSEEAMSRLFPELDANADQWYLVDPSGWLMMRFDATLDYKAVLSDLKFLLKNSGGA